MRIVACSLWIFLEKLTIAVFCCRESTEAVETRAVIFQESPQLANKVSQEEVTAHSEREALLRTIIASTREKFRLFFFSDDRRQEPPRLEKLIPVAIDQFAEAVIRLYGMAIVENENCNNRSTRKIAGEEKKRT